MLLPVCHVIFLYSGADAVSLADQIIQSIHLAADNDLTLSASHDQLDHALCFTQGILIHLGFIFQGKTQPRKAVRQIDYIFFAANCFEHVFGDLFVGCHVKVLLRFPNDHNIRIDSS